MADQAEKKTIRDLSKNQRTLYKYGEEAYEKGNYGYAVMMYRRVLKSVPDLHDIREKLHECQLKKIGGKSNLFRGLWAQIYTSIMAVKIEGLAKKDKAGEALDIAEQCMTIDPTSPAACTAVAKAAELVDLWEAAKITVEFGLKHNPNDVSLIEHAGYVYGEAGYGQDSLRMYTKLRTLQPNNKLWDKMVLQASANASIQKGNLGQDADLNDVIKDKDAAGKLEAQGRTHGTEESRKVLIEDQIASIEEQDSVEKRKRLAALYTADRQWDLAIEWYNKTNELSGVDDPAIQSAVTEIEVYKVEDEITAVQAQVAAGTLDQAAGDEKVNELEWKIHDIKKTGADKILRKFPNNHDVRFQFAELLVDEENFDEALPHFQKIQNNPRYRIRACMFVGNCFAGKGVHDLAVDQYKIVIDEVYHMDDDKKEAYYQLGQCYLHTGRTEEATKCFKEIYQVDVGYKDVQTLITGGA
ncbi:hypothetical protein BVY04_02155 [bacterium M21]|nr:hypothetical protein BVY04_02155 [bacterium M21]